jgi:hypothetical protein
LHPADALSLAAAAATTSTAPAASFATIAALLAVVFAAAAAAAPSFASIKACSTAVNAMLASSPNLSTSSMS